MALKIQQTKADNELISKFKAYAENNGYVLQEVYADAISELIQFYKKNSEGVTFIMQPVDGITVTFRLPEDLIMSAKLAAGTKTSARCFYHTAFVRYARIKKL